MEGASSNNNRHSPRESAAAFLKRMRAVSPADDAAVAEVEAALEERRRPHKGIEL